ncbi:MAG: metallophosphoesterase [Deltaproteobacteria bacterium]|nr:metallophosphoesterase [Deltaproteobacteria bacterium]
MSHRITGAIAFITLFSSIMGLLHWYVWRRLVRDPSWRRPYKITATALICLLGVSLPAGFLLWRVLPRESSAVGATVSYVWLGVLFYLVIILLLQELIRIPVRLIRRYHAIKDLKYRPTVSRKPTTQLLRDSRRRFMARLAAGSALIATGGIATWGMRSVFREIVTPEIPVRLPRLPSALSGYRIAMITDLHIGPILGRDFVENIVEITNRLKPDLISITGDLVDGGVDRLREDIAPLAKLRSRHGVFFVTGNHEYYSGVEGWLRYLPRLGIRVLMNELVTIGDVSPKGASFDLVGIPDHHAGSYHRIAPNISRATDTRDPNRELVVLAHQPVQIVQSAGVQAGLQLSGHTHGGQIYPFGGLVRITQPYISGLHHHTEHTQIYVSTGTGFWGPPMRVAAPAEIALIFLTTA